MTVLRLPRWILRRLVARLVRDVAFMRRPDFIIGGEANPYMLRWYVLGSRRQEHSHPRQDRTARTFFGIARPYLHCFLRSDDDRALHDHPAASISIALLGKCIEHTIDAGGVHRRRRIQEGRVIYRSAKFAHRIEIEPGTEFWTLFIFFRNSREWGFHCPNGWRHWREFTDPATAGATIGKGCGD